MKEKTISYTLSIMKLFLFQWPIVNDAYIDALGDIETSGHELLYFVYSGDSSKVRKRLPRAIFHEHEYALDGEPADGKSEFLTPPSASLIHDMAGVELTVLSMMNKHLDHMTIDERKQVYYQMLGYWDRILEQYRPDALVFSAVPHSVYDYLTYELARRRGMRTIMFDNTVIGDRYLYLTDFRRGSETVLTSFAKLKHERITLDDISPDLREYYQHSLDENAPRVPFYVLKDKKKYSGVNLMKSRARLVLRSIRDGSLLRKVALFLPKYFNENVRKEYRSVTKIPDLTMPFVYVPLNYQPECTTSPQGDIFVVQTLMLEMLSSALPAGWRIYVKEHPSQWGPRGFNFSSSRYKGYYKRIARIPNVTMVSLTVQSSDLIKYSKAVATVSGTAGWEALLRQKPVIIFGHPWYQNAPSLLRVDSVESCREGLESVSRGHKVHEEENLRFLKALEEGTVHRHFQEGVNKQSSLTLEESAAAVTKVVLQMLATTI
ncbi:MAG: hypothetical protein COV91_00845 [Candidatus Taylorbacteria bacterium CG11_big_fil_rev_8_21_14_0_20_46_11]|uniref:Capsular biosynthesis protein n=1 Tax=Candidatus Taylorbacteria bacterium CG11_big_fil_rev_8_21_14_0_20_46_11 TaxID=1975025 RepID=A0A2H0KCP6_9BACT|nr:MAG: hypothetical protein COV91_00845 [Candidatus Taylorbacteria bacterium CG11_big_fil_rev_8_21_14_0_20_46_11]